MDIWIKFIGLWISLGVVFICVWDRWVRKYGWTKGDDDA